MTPSESRLAALRSLVTRLKEVVRTGRHNLDSKLRARSMVHIASRMGRDGDKICGDSLWKEANDLIGHLRALGYFNQNVIVSAIPRPKALPEDKPKRTASEQKQTTIQPASKAQTVHKKRSKQKRHRKTKNSSKPHLIYTGGFENSRRRH